MILEIYIALLEDLNPIFLTFLSSVNSKDVSVPLTILPSFIPGVLLYKSAD